MSKSNNNRKIRSNRKIRNNRKNRSDRRKLTNRDKIKKKFKGGRPFSGRKPSTKPYVVQPRKEGSSPSTDCSLFPSHASPSSTDCSLFPSHASPSSSHPASSPCSPPALSPHSPMVTQEKYNELNEKYEKSLIEHAAAVAVEVILRQKINELSSLNKSIQISNSDKDKKIDQVKKILEEALICPITHTTFKNPVVAQDGHTYEKSAILMWFDSGKYTSPTTRAKVEPVLLKNHLVEGLIDRLISETKLLPASLSEPSA